MTQPNELSNREREVINLLLEGKSNKQIASALVISVRTVEFHLKNIYDKLQVRSRVELVLKLGSSTGTGGGERPAVATGANNEKELGVATVTGRGVELGTAPGIEPGIEPGAEKAKGLVISTVAGEEKIAENRDRLKGWSWAAVWQEAVSRIGKEIKMISSTSANIPNEGRMMTFSESIRVCFAKYADFNGQATRPEFWWFALFFTLVVAASTKVSEVLGYVVSVALLLPLLAVGTRRLRDSGQSGWWQLLWLLPVGGIVWLGFLWAEPTVSQQPDDTRSQQPEDAPSA